MTKAFIFTSDATFNLVHENGKTTCIETNKTIAQTNEEFDKVIETLKEMCGYIVFAK